MANTKNTHYYPARFDIGLQTYKSDNIIDFQRIRYPLDDYNVDRPKRPAKKSGFISVRVPDVIKEHMQAIADAQDRPLSWLVCKVLQHYHEHGLMDEIVSTRHGDSR